MNDKRWIQVNPVVFQGRGYTANEDRAFVIMPFRPKWSSSVFDTIRQALTELSIKCVRADEQYGQQIREDIWQGICEAGVVIADVTGCNANVFYELGIAHVMGRRVILLTQSEGDIPFDIRIYRHIMYKIRHRKPKQKQEMAKLSAEIKKTVEWIRENEALPSGHEYADIYRELRRVQRAESPGPRR